MGNVNEDDPRLRHTRDKVLQGGGELDSCRFQFLLAAEHSVIADHLMAFLCGAQGKVTAHAAQADDSELHSTSPPARCTAPSRCTIPPASAVRNGLGEHTEQD